MIDLTSQWMDGPSILAAPVLSEANTATIVLPSIENGYFFELNSTVTHAAPSTIELSNVAIDRIPAFVPSGSILPLAPYGLQSTTELPGGPVEVQIYAGDDVSFDLIDDDG